MIACRACGDWIDEGVRACPSCGMPNALRRQSTGWLSFQGRITAREYWLFYALPIAVADLFSGVVDAAAQAGGIIDAIATVVTLVGSLAGATKRLHDRDRSGWFQLIVLIPLLGWIWIFAELSVRGTRGPNRYGPDPLAGRGR
jgi:uncharacterized membrane protein YhaH (DUF805 family)